ncbi:MAG TPA: hypothetical protein VMY77_05675 [Chitinophagaceae bacterium]|nr:hypothetical protein [Chitinophagaceae bacterium]
MNIIFFFVKVTIISFGLSSCKLSAKKLKENLEKEPHNDIPIQSVTKHQTAMPDSFITRIGITNDNIVFSRDGKVCVQLKNGHQKFDITQLHEQHRLYGLKNFMLMSK